MVYLQTPRVFQSLMVLSREPETIWRLSAEKATLKTSFVWPTNDLVVWPLKKPKHNFVGDENCYIDTPQYNSLLNVGGCKSQRAMWSNKLYLTCDLYHHHLRAKVPQAEGRVPSSWQSKLSIGGDDHITHKMRVTPQRALGDSIVGLITGQLPHDERLVWKRNKTLDTWHDDSIHFKAKYTYTMTPDCAPYRKPVAQTQRRTLPPTYNTACV